MRAQQRCKILQEDRARVAVETTKEEGPAVGQDPGEAKGEEEEEERQLSPEKRQSGKESAAALTKRRRRRAKTSRPPGKYRLIALKNEERRTKVSKRVSEGDKARPNKGVGWG